MLCEDYFNYLAGVPKFVLEAIAYPFFSSSFVVQKFFFFLNKLCFTFAFINSIDSYRHRVILSDLVI